jgi:hypothetical protein
VPGTPSVVLTAQTGSISEGTGAAISATNTTSGDLALTAGTDIVANGTVTAAGAVAGTPSVALTAQAGSIGQSAGALITATNAPPGVALTAGGGIAFGGSIATSGTAGSVALTAKGGDISETAPGAASPTGVVRTALLTGSASGKAAFDTASGNQVIKLGPFNTGAGDFTLIDSESLTIAGALNVVGGSAAITALNGADPFGIATPGDLTINAGAPLTASNNVVLRADHTISNNDTVTARNGAVTFTAGSGDINNSTAVAGAGNVLFSAAGNINNNGVIRGNGVTLNAAGSISSPDCCPGLVRRSGAMRSDITDTGGVSAGRRQAHARRGVVDGGTITAPISNGARQQWRDRPDSQRDDQGRRLAGGLVDRAKRHQPQRDRDGTGHRGRQRRREHPVERRSIRPARWSRFADRRSQRPNLSGTPAKSNRVVQLASFTSGQTLTLDDGVGLTITGPLTAPSIVIDTGANPLTLADKATITTGGIDRPPGIIPSTDFPPDKLTTSGAYFTTSSGFTQKGTSTILGIGGVPSILRITASGDANITFDPLAGLQGRNTWLILDIQAGKAIGQINVKNLDVIQTGQAGAAGLTGSVTGLAGSAAAGVSGIQPSPNSNFRINSCPIASVNCVLLSTLAVPTANPLNDINIGTLSNPNDEYDLLLPIVSDQDY